MSINNREFARALAAALGGSWFVEPATQDWHQQHPTLTNTEGHSFWLSGGSDTRDNKFSVHPNWPKDAKGEEHRPSVYAKDYADPSINFSATKSAEQAAKDITRRFLPVYLPLFERLNTEAHQADNTRANYLARAKAAAAIVGGEVGEDNNHLATVRVRYNSENGPGITDVELNYREGFRFTVSGSLELLQAVQDLINKQRGGV